MRTMNSLEINTETSPGLSLKVHVCGSFEILIQN